MPFTSKTFAFIATSLISPDLVMTMVSIVTPLPLRCSLNEALKSPASAWGGWRMRWCWPMISDFSLPTNFAAAGLHSIKMPVLVSATKIASNAPSNCIRYFSSASRTASSAFLRSVMSRSAPLYPISFPSPSISGTPLVSRITIRPSFLMFRLGKSLKAPF